MNAEPYDPARPKVNFDETSKQLIKETRLPLPPQAGQVAKYDYEYERNGTANLFLFVEPQAGWRHVAVTSQRTKVDFAHQMRWLVDQRYPNAKVIRLTLDNLNTHQPSALYEAFPPEEARRIVTKLEFQSLLVDKSILSGKSPFESAVFDPKKSLPKVWQRSKARAVRN